MADWQPYFVNIRKGVVVGTQDPDMPDGTYVRVDVLPSAGGSVWDRVMGRVAASQIPDPAVNEVSGQRERLYLICKHGMYYRPNCQGYTSSAAEAGRYTLVEAEKETHPNGPNGPRDGMSYIPAPADLAAVQPAQVQEPTAWRMVDAIQKTTEFTEDHLSASFFGTINGYTVTPLYCEPQPDPRDEVLASLEHAVKLYEEYTLVSAGIETGAWINTARAALAAAKAVQK